MSSEEKNKKINLYVLRYKHSGHYYVGTAENFEKRMLVHWRRESGSVKRLPNWSFENKSKQGFIFYLFNIEGDGVSQSYADLCENHLAKLIARKIKYINEKKFIKEVHVGNNKFIDGKVGKYDKNNNVNSNQKELNDIDKGIYMYLKNLKSLNPQKVNKRLSIKCIEIGCVSEYHQNDSWNEAVVRFKFSCENKEK
ncbi:MAG: hypothetical protein K2I22_06170 [Lachnospiraceae bacterium]|nr:hypothetical protein [Lachnospiraceae bacterium]